MSGTIQAPWQERRAAAQVTFAYRYLLALPEGYAATAPKRWPLLVFLHGRGERGSNLEHVKRHGPPKLITEGRAFPFIVVAPQCPADEWWNSAALDAFVAAVLRRYRVDRERVYLTGLSMGGFGAWALAQHRPSRYAAVIPICGGGEVRLAERLRDVPIWAFHGARDDVIPVSRSREMIAAVKAAGGRPRLTIHPRAGHDAWTQTYTDERIYRWLLSHRRPRTST